MLGDFLLFLMSFGLLATPVSLPGSCYSTDPENVVRLSLHLPPPSVGLCGAQRAAPLVARTVLASPGAIWVHPGTREARALPSPPVPPSGPFLLTWCPPFTHGRHGDGVSSFSPHSLPRLSYVECCPACLSGHLLSTPNTTTTLTLVPGLSCLCLVLSLVSYCPNLS